MDIGLNDILMAINTHFKGISISIQHNCRPPVFDNFNYLAVDFRIHTWRQTAADRNHAWFLQIFHLMNQLHQCVWSNFRPPGTKDGLGSCAHIIDNDISAGFT